MAKSKGVLVTGANSGIGLVTVVELAKAGYDVVGTARSSDKAAGIHQAAERAGVRVRTVVCDVSTADGSQAAVTEAEGLTGGVWGLVNNAGYAQAGAVEDVDDEAVRAQLEVNVVTPARLARLVLPGMRERGDGRIVNVSSIAGRVSVPLTGWYCASKHALEAVSDALRIEVAPFGVKVVLIEPGGFGTNIWSAAEVPTAHAEVYAQAYRRAQQVTGNGRRLPDPVWVARAIRLALGVPRPLPRYLVGFDAMGGVLAESVTPTFVTDLVKQAATGLRRLPFRS